VVSVAGVAAQAPKAQARRIDNAGMILFMAESDGRDSTAPESFYRQIASEK